MKKTVILLLLVSFCGGTTEPGSATSEDVSVEANEATPEVKNENDHCLLYTSPSPRDPE